MTLALLVCLAIQAEAPLTQAEIELLNAPFRDGLFDPAAENAQRIHGTISLRTCYGNRKSMDARGWLVAAAPGRPARFVLNSLQETDPPGDAAPAPFPDPTFEEESRLPSFADVSMGRSLGGAQQLLFAAWSRRLGRDAEAVKLLRALKPEKLLEQFRGAYGWELFSDAVNAFMVADDADALAAAERLAKFPSEYLPQGDQLRTDLLHRREAGTFGKHFTALPVGLRELPVDRRIGPLIAALDQLENEPINYGGMTLNHQAVALELVACGEAAVPALLRCFESDPRLTRSVGVWREWQPDRTVLSVRAAAFRILVAILRTNHWEARKHPRWMDPDNLEGQKAWSGLLRRYWETNRTVPFPERRMCILGDPDATVEELKEAAENLARLDRMPSIDAWRRLLPADDPLLHEPSPKLAPFQAPTAAEAVLASMERHMKAVASVGNWAECAERDYLTYLAELGDRRIVPALRARLERSKDPRSAHRLAFTLRRLGEHGPMDALACEVEGGLEPVDSAGADVIKVEPPACDEVLLGFVRPDHPWHERAKKEILEWSYSHEAWVAHPFCLSLLHSLLQDESATGVVVVAGRDYAERLGAPQGGFQYGGRLAKEHKERAVERVCDPAAFRLSELLPDGPPYHPLILDSEARLRELRLYVDRHLGNLRRMTRQEMADRRLPWCGVHWVVAR
jgi:hypothetical protein